MSQYGRVSVAGKIILRWTLGKQCIDIDFIGLALYVVSLCACVKTLMKYFDVTHSVHHD